MGIWYCTREDVMSAADVKETARLSAQVDRAIEAASRDVEGYLNRRFYPLTTTKYFPWPVPGMSSYYVVELGDYEVVTVATLVSGGTTIVAADYFLEPANAGPPYRSIEIDLSSNATLVGGSTHQRNVAVTGVFGYNADEDTAGTLALAITTTSATTGTISDSSVIGIGDIIRVDTERMIVTGKSMLTSAQTGSLSASQADVSLTVATGSSFNVGETILMDSERMYVVDIAGNVLTVKRAVEGTVLAAHATATIYYPRTVTLTRGALGTTAATHLINAPIYRHLVPGLVRELCVAIVLVILSQRSASYARTVGTGESQRESGGRGLKQIRDDAYLAHGRKDLYGTAV